jgi:hypothetical protein
MITRETLFGRRLGHALASVAFLGAIGCGVNTGKPIERGARPRVVLGEMVTPSGVRETPPSAVPFSQTCLSGEVVIGYRGTADGVDPVNQLRSVQGWCAALSVVGVTTLQVIATPSETMPLVGTTPGNVEQTQTCPSNEVVVAFAGRSGSDIDQIAVVCAPIVIRGTYPNFQLSIGDRDPRPPIGNAGGAPFGEIACPAGQVTVGDEGRAATIINTFGLLCANPTLVL